MLEIARDYHRRYGPSAVRCFVADLMDGDKPTLKSGYSRENAIIAAAEAFDLSREEVEAKVDA